MKSLPGIKIVGFVALLLIVGFAVAARTQDQRRKHSKYLVKFGWSENGVVDCSDRNQDDIDQYLMRNEHYVSVEEARKFYKVQRYNGEGIAPDPPQGELDICLPRAAAATTAPDGEPSPSATPKGAKTQLTGYALFGNTKEAQAFADYVNGTPTPTPTPTPKPTQKKR